MGDKNVKRMRGIQRAACLLLLALAAFHLNAEVRFTGENPRQDERLFRQALTLIKRAEPGNRVLSLEEMEEVVNLEFVPNLSILGHNYSGIYEYFPDGRDPIIRLKAPGKGRNRRDVAATLAHEGKHFLNFTAFPFSAVEDMLPPSLNLIFQVIDEGAAFYNEIKTAERSFRYRFKRAPAVKPSFEHVYPESAYYIGGEFITRMGIDLKKWMRRQSEYRTLSSSDFEKEFKKEFFKLFLGCILFPTRALDIPCYNQTFILGGEQPPDTIELPSWANPEFAYLREIDVRNFLIRRALEACFGDIAVSPDECGYIFNETLAKIDAYRENQNLPTISQIEHAYHEYAGNADNPQWLKEKSISQVTIQPPYLQNSKELIDTIMDGHP